ncbi:hypothetical protein GCM10007207_02260 [Asaia siamensis]|uniref:Uncharacterized protein n=1 Tax=Asaia siamensis TaxID=110479 RepID=A0ABQ1LD56_9PROT|nr:hypothetical protein GCM10007207_02260 [Asaia siamensis]
MEFEGVTFFRAEGQALVQKGMIEQILPRKGYGERFGHWPVSRHEAAFPRESAGREVNHKPPEDARSPEPNVISRKRRGPYLLPGRRAGVAADNAHRSAGSAWRMSPWIDIKRHKTRLGCVRPR